MQVIMGHLRGSFWLKIPKTTGPDCFQSYQFLTLQCRVQCLLLDYTNKYL